MSKVLIALCLVATLFALGCGPYPCPGNLPTNITDRHETELESERTTADRLKRLGGKVSVDIAKPGKPVVQVDLTTLDVKDELFHLKAFVNLESLSLARTNILNDDLVNLRDSSSIRRLWLNGTKITDSGLAHLNRLVSLEVLYLFDTRITAAGLRQLRGLPKLQVVVDENCVSQEEAKQLEKAIPLKSITRW